MKQASEVQVERVFFKAAHLLFPDLDESDPRLEKVAMYAKKAFKKNSTRSCVLLAMEDSTSNTFRRFYRFSKKLGLNPGMREVIIAEKQPEPDLIANILLERGLDFDESLRFLLIMYTSNYHINPEPVEWEVI